MDFVNANGLRFAYLTAGSGPLVLFLHGFPDTPYTWDHAMPEVATAGFRAAAPFLRGYFPTEIPADGAYDGDTLGRDAVALIEAFGADQAIVVGHDWGALAAYTAAAMAPERVKALVTITVPHPASVLPTPRMLWAIRHFLPLRRTHGGDTIRANDFAYVDELWRRWSPEWKDIPPSETAHVKESLSHPGSAEAAAAYYRALSLRMSPWLKQKIAVPTFAFAGLHDNISSSSFERARSRFTSTYEVVEVPGGHFMQREHPSEFNAALLRVLQEAR